MINLSIKIKKLYLKNITEAVKWGSCQLKIAEILNYKKEAQLLLAHVMDFSYLEIIIENKLKLNINQINNFVNYIYRRANHEPFAYIVGYKEFMGFNFLVDKNVFIPRCDTEIIVEQVLKFMPDQYKKYKCLDMCTGTGCIAISLALMRLNILVDAVDICKDSIMVLKKNIKQFKLKSRVKAICSDLLNSYVVDKQLDFIIANPPYIENNDYLKLKSEVRDFGPKKALVSSYSNSISCYKILIENSSKYLNNNGKLIFEFGFKQENELSKLSNKNFKSPVFFKDYSGIIRGCIFEKR